MPTSLYSWENFVVEVKLAEIDAAGNLLSIRDYNSFNHNFDLFGILIYHWLNPDNQITLRVTANKVPFRVRVRVWYIY